MKTKLIVKTLLAGMLLTACGPTDEQRGKYIVTAKADNKIVYHPVKDSNDIHVMVFEPQKSIRDDFYPYIRVGDTIRGLYLEDVISKSVYYDRTLGYTSTISTVNGKNFRQMQKIAQRDSIIRAMQEKVK